MTPCMNFKARVYPSLASFGFSRVNGTAENGAVVGLNFRMIESRLNFKLPDSR